jgi:transcriptional regulator
MYLPPQFKQDDIAKLHEAIGLAPFATLVTLNGDGLIASHLPMYVEPGPGPYGTLVGHLARPNPQWRDPSASVQALAIFTGPHGYVTPSWYPTKHETGKAVPTWNYVSVHAYGSLRVVEDPDRLLAIVTRLTQIHEAGRSEPWAVSDAPPDFVTGMLRGIVGVELPIERLDGKWKLSQNRTPADQAGVVDGLRADGTPPQVALADVMAGR